MATEQDINTAHDYAQYSLQCLIIHIREQFPFISTTEAARAAAKAIAALEPKGKHWADIVPKAVDNVRKEEAEQWKQGC